LLIDDVTTTGNTLEECARTLKTARAARVDAAVFAKEA
jgi:predicted amidophosphoribosyltransferase